jgi:dGTPase
MDLADDIAYSTYDIEDAFKSGFLDPMSMVCAEDSLLAKVGEELNIREGIYLSICEIRTILMDVFRHELDFENGHYRNNYQKSRQLANSGYLRTRLTSFLVHDCIANIECIYNNQCPPLSQVYLTDKMRAQVETLKLFVYNVVISAPKMNIIRYRGREIIRDLFDLLLASKPDNSLLPQDVAEIFYSYDPQQEAQRKRIIADFISSMTDRYAVELYNQFRSDASQTIFKPL